MTRTPNYSPERLRSLFQPRSIVLVGASEKSTWSWNFHNILHDGHFTGPVHYVNPRGGTVHGLPAFSRLSDISEPVDPLVVRQLRRRPDYSPSIEFQLLFSNLPDRMATATGRELARERYAFMEEFFMRLKKEAEGEV